MEICNENERGAAIGKESDESLDAEKLDIDGWVEEGHEAQFLEEFRNVSGSHLEDRM